MIRDYNPKYDFMHRSNLSKFPQTDSLTNPSAMVLNVMALRFRHT
ncbi:hypothetical protein HCUR_01006 [Holospora curviuscula]|uniref:Uncharacterized protein n=1 Tax=Holospora curviuscula TaxID=1082868 RepID=A0A2S5R8R9_9PROT|nr:hypothetical protein HCUR_01006 [Holospora curviuscula]